MDSENAEADPKGQSGGEKEKPKELGEKEEKKRGNRGRMEDWKANGAEGSGEKAN